MRDNDGCMASALGRLLAAIERQGKPFCVIGCGASGRCDCMNVVPLTVLDRGIVAVPQTFILTCVGWLPGA